MSWTSEAWKVIRQFARPVDYRDIADRTGMSTAEAQNCIWRLVRANCIRFVYGSPRTGKYYEAIAGAQLPPDGRGKHPNSKAALDAARSPSMRPSAPISQITAARLVVSPLQPKRRRRSASCAPTPTVMPGRK